MSQLKESQHLYIPLKDIEIATKHFEECIGKGGYGWVYKGELFISGKRTTVAVKRLNENLGQGLKEFLTEIQLLSGQIHPNLISLLGYCDEGKEKIIVYEYAERGSLDRYIRRTNTTRTLTWLERLKLCLDAARGLEFLHNHVGKHQSIIHRDVKSANILIDQNWVAKISDLGLSKLSLAGLNRSAVISHACGTPGYCEPEYIISGIVKKESDVYSFGMVLFEVLCGRLCSVTDDDGFLLSAKLVKNSYEKNKLVEIVDPGIRQMSSDSLKKFSAIAYGCLADVRDQRPSMNEVVKGLAELVKIQTRLNKEQEEELKKKEKGDPHLYRIIKVARDDDLREQIGKHIYFDLVDHDKVHSFRVRKHFSFALFKEDVAIELGIAVQYQRFWLLAPRLNHTYRLNRPLTPEEEAKPVKHLKENINEANNSELKLFLEVELGQDLRPIPLPKKTKGDILIFFKLYDPLKEELRYVGRLFVKDTTRPTEILSKLNELAGYAPDETIELFEEIKFEPHVMCEHIDKWATFRGSQLEDGDIICFQKPLKVEHIETCRYPDVPSFLEYIRNHQIRLEEQEDLKRKEKAEAHLYKIIKVARDEDLREQIGKHIYFDLVDHDKVHSFRILKQLSFALFKEDVALEFGIAVRYQRFWLLAKRQNKTYRLHRPLTPQEEAQPVGDLTKSSKDANNAELKLFLEVELGQDVRPISLPKKTREDILLFFKLYDPLKEELRYVGRLFVKASGRPIEILARLNELAGYAPDEEIELFEEIKIAPRVMCEQIDKSVTFRVSLLEDGDIICFQKPLTVKHTKTCRCPDVPSFLEYIHNHQLHSTLNGRSEFQSSSSKPDALKPISISSLSRSEKVWRILQQFDINNDACLNKEEMVALVIALNPGDKFSDEDINNIIGEIYREYEEFIDSVNGLTYTGLLKIYDDGKSDLDRDFEALELRM